MKKSFVTFYTYVIAAAFPNTSPALMSLMLISSPAHGVARMSAPEPDKLSSDESASSERHSPAAAWQLRRMQMLHLVQRPAERMRRASHAFVPLVPLVSMLMTAPLPVQSAPLAQFDGRWSVLVITDQGNCSIYRYGVIVDHGRARYAGAADFTIDGSITSSGLVRATISRGSDHARVQGRLGRRTGFGRWNLAGGYDCSGHWTAERREADPGLASGEE